MCPSRRRRAFWLRHRSCRPGHDPRRIPALVQDGASEAWFSSVTEPVLDLGEDERWTFGRWMVAGVKVELAHIDDPSTGHLLIETPSATVWTLGSWPCACS